MTAQYLGIYSKDRMPSDDQLGIFYVTDEGWFASASGRTVGPYLERTKAAGAFANLLEYGDGIHVTAEDKTPLFTFTGVAIVILVILFEVFWKNVSDFAVGLFQ